MAGGLLYGHQQYFCYSYQMSLPSERSKMCWVLWEKFATTPKQLWFFGIGCRQELSK